MKVNYDKKMIRYCLYIIITVISIYLGIIIISNFGNIFNSLIKLLTSFYLLIRPLIFALLIAYLLIPLRNFFEKIFKNNRLYKIKKPSRRRLLAVVLSYIFIIGIIIGIICGIYFMIGGQLSRNTNFSNIISEVINYFKSDNSSTNSIKNTLNELDVPFLDSFKPYLIELVNKLQEYIINNFGSMTSSIMSIGSSIFSFFIGLIISIYILIDSDYFINLWKKIYTVIFRDSKVGKSITKCFKIIHSVFSKFFKGQFLEAFFVGVLSAIALSIVGIDYAVVIGLISGICNLIPYVGPLVGTVLAAIMGLLSGEPLNILYAIISMIIVQQIDNHLLAPKIVGNSVGLHPVFTMLAIIIGGNIGGLIGMLISVPLFASFRIFFNMWYENKFNSHNK